ncbi:hypothetical protein [Allorhizobium taibaishanense]|nr:hypothetical protein [Allorhizobium taibaishanense]MBB4006441.1 hypothetical protein [Allorhizobium taibaishanense]
MQMIHGLLSGATICIEKVETGRFKPVCLTLRKALDDQQQIRAQFRRAVANVVIMLLADDECMAVNVWLQRKKANKMITFQYNIGRRLPADDAAKIQSFLISYYDP